MPWWPVPAACPSVMITRCVRQHEAARLLSDWDPARRDENVEYYMAKLQALFEKFAPATRQTDMLPGF